MSAYIVKRLLWAIPGFFGAISIIFLLLRILPGDVALSMLGGGEGLGTVDNAALEALREQLGLNASLWDQYSSFIGGIFRGDLGTSAWTGFSIGHEIGIRLPYTLLLVVLSLLLSAAIAIPVGIFTAIYRDTWIDYVLRSGTIAGIAAPNFWIALLLLTLTINLFQWAPPLGYAPIYEKPGVALQQLILPAFILGIRLSATTARMLRSSMLEVLGNDYIRTARAKGLRERTVIYLHALKNAMLPVITIVGGELIMVVGGSVIIEKIFNIPGMGRLLIDAVNLRDFPMVQGVVTIIVAYVIIVNLGIDLLYAKIDPRIRLK